MTTRRKSREVVAWAPLPADKAASVSGPPLPKGPCLLQSVGPGGVWRTLSRHTTGALALAERDRLRLWPNRIITRDELRDAVTHFQMKPLPPAVEADVLATLPVERRGF